MNASWARLCSTVLLSAAGMAASLSASAAPPSYRAHEWGTFTSIQGADGAPIAWNPFTRSDLPSFVYSRQRPMPPAVIAKNPLGFSLLGGKDGRAWRQRMETPVIYFHADEPLTVRARVGFPQGLLTEWYPWAASFGPVFGVDNVLPESGASFLEWPAVQLSPRGAQSKALLLTEAGDSHYYAAREVEASDVTVAADSGASAEADRFLFYRGAGNFSTPLRISMPGPRELLLENQGKQALRGLQVVEARGERAYHQPIAELAAGESRRVSLPESEAQPERSSATEKLAQSLLRDLTADGLHADEAAAMIETWRDAWFGEDGLRVLYLLPREWTDAALPLELTPAPTELVRVMVGRAEIFTPAEERSARAAFASYRSTRDVRELRPGYLAVNPRFQEALLSRVGALEEQWQETQKIFRHMAPLIQAKNDPLAEDLRSAREALVQWRSQETASKKATAPADPTGLGTPAGILAGAPF